MGISIPRPFHKSHILGRLVHVVARSRNVGTMGFVVNSLQSTKSRIAFVLVPEGDDKLEKFFRPSMINSIEF